MSKIANILWFGAAGGHFWNREFASKPEAVCCGTRQFEVRNVLVCLQLRHFSIGREFAEQITRLRRSSVDVPESMKLT